MEKRHDEPGDVESQRALGERPRGDSEEVVVRRTFGSQDFPRVAQMVLEMNLHTRRICERFAPEDGLDLRMHSIAEAARFLADPATVVLVAERGFEAVGLLVLKPGAAFGTVGECYMVPAFYVEPDARGGPAAWPLWKEAKTRAGNVPIQAPVVASNEKVRKLHERFGFRPLAIVMERVP